MHLRNRIQPIAIGQNAIHRNHFFHPQPTQRLIKHHLLVLLSEVVSGQRQLRQFVEAPDSKSLTDIGRVEYLFLSTLGLSAPVSLSEDDDRISYVKDRVAVNASDKSRILI